MFIFKFFNIFFPNKPCGCGCNCCDINLDSLNNITYFLPIYLSFFVLAILDILNDGKINDNYDKLIYNWEMGAYKIY